jgi:hypothetical protein
MPTRAQPSKALKDDESRIQFERDLKDAAKRGRLVVANSWETKFSYFIGVFSWYLENCAELDIEPSLPQIPGLAVYAKHIQDKAANRDGCTDKLRDRREKIQQYQADGLNESAAWSKLRKECPELLTMNRDGKPFTRLAFHQAWFYRKHKAKKPAHNSKS